MYIKMAKLNPLFMLVIALVVVLLFFIVTSWQDYVPYDNVQPKYAAYEPFTEKLVENGDDSSNVKTNALSNKLVYNNPSEQKSTDNGGSLIKSALSGVNSYAHPSGSLRNCPMPASSSTENFEPLMESPKSIHYGLFRDSEIIDKFSQVTANGQDGVNGCVSSGLSNAGGYICLTPELIQMLKTRGGNAAGK